MALPTEGFLLEIAPDRVVVGDGPFEALPHRRTDRPACYAPDFFLRNPAPWLHPMRWREVSRAELRAELEDAPAPQVCWADVDADQYATDFDLIQREIAAGRLTKAVPIVVERGTAADASVLPFLLGRVLCHPEPSYAYALWHASGGMVGVTPEILFRRADSRRVETVAMAGTVPLARTGEITDDPKECREHQSVVEDITEALASLGTVAVGERDVIALPTMAHLRTPITVDLDTPAEFAALIDALHPTAALGVAPRSAGLGVLHGPAAAERGRFGAPFGVEWPDGRALVVVAIRNVQWDGAALRLGAGAGVIAESRLEREWDELALKRTAVKGMLGL
jgi:menaquinone-specific isochorismate synthase